ERYIFAHAALLGRHVCRVLQQLAATTATERMRDFAAELTNWYIRRSRDRFWGDVTEDPASREAFDTLFTVLETLCRVAAPMIPLVAERVWQGLTGGRSVHLTDWPDAEAFPAAADIRAAMDAVRELSSVGNALRKKEKLRVRLPLARFTVVSPLAESLAQFEDILREELNVKSVELVQLSDTAASEYGISHRLSVNARAAGPRLGKDVQRVIRAAKDGLWTEEGGVVTADGIALEPHEYELALETSGRPEGEALAIVPTGGFVLLDTTMTPELEAEGLVRDVIRAVQDTRKQADFDVSDRIRLQLLFTDEGDKVAVDSRYLEAGLPEETLARDVRLLLAPDDVAAPASADPAQWPAETGDAVGVAEPEFVALIPAGTYANAADFFVAVTRIGAPE